MAIEYVDSTQLDSDLTSVANAIRAKSGGSSQLAFPAGFVSEIGNIPSGGGGKTVTLLASGTYTKTDEASKPRELHIPVSFTGTPTFVLVNVPTPISGVNQSIQWARQFDIPSAAESLLLNNTVKSSTGYSSSGTYYYAGTAAPSFNQSQTEISCSNVGGVYLVKDNTYNWYIWGYAE